MLINNNNKIHNRMKDEVKININELGIHVEIE